MLRTIMIAFAAATAIGISVTSAAPVNGSVITAAAYENGTTQQVWWRGWGWRWHQFRDHFRHHRWGWLPTPTTRRDRLQPPLPSKPAEEDMKSRLQPSLPSGPAEEDMKSRLQPSLPSGPAEDELDYLRQRMHDPKWPTCTRC
jgi:hypothetical protein